MLTIWGVRIRIKIIFLLDAHIKKTYIPKLFLYKKGDLFMSNNELTLDQLKIDNLKIDDLEVSKFLDNIIDENSEAISKVMAASCTTCECCCS